MQEAATIPGYLHETYWWAYVHPNAVRLFERQWLVNLILWGNFAKLRDVVDIEPTQLAHPDACGNRNPDAVTHSHNDSRSDSDTDADTD